MFQIEVFDLIASYDPVYPEICHKPNGSFTGNEAKLLYAITCEVAPVKVLEIGCGITTNIILKALERNSNHGQLWTYAKDRWDSIQENDNWHWTEGDARETLGSLVVD